jgi:hypothetical protein
MYYVICGYQIKNMLICDFVLDVPYVIKLFYLHYCSKLWETFKGLYYVKLENKILHTLNVFCGC